MTLFKKVLKYYIVTEYVIFLNTARQKNNVLAELKAPAHHIYNSQKQPFSGIMENRWSRSLGKYTF